jgi:hypothetical protein
MRSPRMILGIVGAMLWTAACSESGPTGLAGTTGEPGGMAFTLETW